MLLNGVISQMNLRVFVVLGAKLVRAGPQVPFLVPVPLKHSVDAGYQDVVPNVKLTLVVEQRLLYVLLENKGPVRAIRIPLSPPQSELHIIETCTNGYSRASVGELSWFCYPDVSYCPITLLLVLELLVSLYEFLVLRVLNSFGDVESHGQDCEYVFFSELIVLAHRIEHGLFVANERVGDEVICDEERLTRLYLESLFEFQEPGSLQICFVVQIRFDLRITLHVLVPENHLLVAKYLIVGIPRLGLRGFLSFFKRWVSILISIHSTLLGV